MFEILLNSAFWGIEKKSADLRISGAAQIRPGASKFVALGRM